MCIRNYRLPAFVAAFLILGLLWIRSVWIFVQSVILSLRVKVVCWTPRAV